VGKIETDQICVQELHKQFTQKFENFTNTESHAMIRNSYLYVPAHMYKEENKAEI
jgi:hypothetical protein